MKRVEPAPGIGKHRSGCEAMVRITEANTSTKRRREARALKAGQEPGICNRPSMYLVDGKSLCQAHAGQAAVHILMEGS